ncbi:hypothetical protein [Streptomyces sp. NPDC127072]|uniref:hypothetical protein n=1 Tax=Streptomyces sp. NPDC127072 TaxID=3347129 RepID=UPI003649964C
MSDSFMVAARIPMTRDGFEAWLGAPIPDASRIVNSADMFDGWFWDGRRADAEWDSVGAEMTPRDLFSERVEDSCSGEPSFGVLLHRDGALEAYLFHLGYDKWSVHTAMLALAAAGEFKSEPAEDTVLFWAETGANLWAADDTGWLAVLSIGKSEARFVDARDLTDVVADLKPVESRFFEMMQQMGPDTPRDPAFTDPSVLEQPGIR